MTLDSDGHTERLLRIAEGQAAASAAMAETQRYNLSTVKSIEENMAESTAALRGINEQLRAMEKARLAAVSDIKESIASAFKAGDAWWRRSLVIVTVAIVLSNLLGIAVGDRLLDLISKVRP